MLYKDNGIRPNITNLSDEHKTLLDEVEAELIAQTGNKDVKAPDAFRLIFDKAIAYNNIIKAKSTGLGSGTAADMTSHVKERMELNRTTKKVVQIGSGKNRRDVLFERRAITPKIVSKSLDGKKTRFNSTAVDEWLKSESTEFEGTNQQWLDNHNKWLLEESGEPDPDTFNRRAGAGTRRHNDINQGGE